MAIVAGTIHLRIEPLPLTQNTEAGDTYEPGIPVYHPWYSDRQRFPACQHAIMAVYYRSYCVLSHAYSSLSPSCLILNELRGRIVCIILRRYKPLSGLRKSESSSDLGLSFLDYEIDLLLFGRLSRIYRPCGIRAVL